MWRQLPIFTFAALTVLLFFQVPTKAQDHASSTISWDRPSLRLIAPGGDYPRMVRMIDGTIVCGYDRDQKMWARISHDDTKTWSDPILVATGDDSWLTNASLLPLKYGRLFYFWNDRPMETVRYGRTIAPPGKLTRPIRILFAISSDEGRTWSSPRVLYSAGPSFLDGCWEPAGLQLPSGEIQVYFSNEKPFETTDEQEIAILRSRDGGKNWAPAQRISLRKDHRDGMPAPILLATGKGIAVAIEDNGLSGDTFKPSILFTSLADNWTSGVINGQSSQRWGALETPLNPHWYAGAPFLARTDSGLVLLSFQQSTDGSMDHSRMVVCIGDPTARHFAHPTYPFPSGPSANLWNSLFAKDNHSVIALTSTKIAGQFGIWAINGRIETTQTDLPITH
ncbi:MAG TPA: sialidase family protein [Tepidisphaeraceae bacterium]|jgi:hypothetical protein